MTIPSGSAAVEALLGILLEEIGLHQALAADLEREHRFLIAMSVEEFLPIEAGKESTLERIRSNAQKLQNCMKSLTSDLMGESENITLSRVISFLEEPDRSRIRRAQEQLVALAERVRDQNRANERLLHGSLAYLNQYVHLLRMVVGDAAGYRADGTLPEQQQSGRILALKG
jgi:flagellar biosynthesis/type III secretory pathway chaperone